MKKLLIVGFFVAMGMQGSFASVAPVVLLEQNPAKAAAKFLANIPSVALQSSLKNIGSISLKTKSDRLFGKDNAYNVSINDVNARIYITNLLVEGDSGKLKNLAEQALNEYEIQSAKKIDTTAKANSIKFFNKQLNDAAKNNNNKAMAKQLSFSVKVSNFLTRILNAIGLGNGKKEMLGSADEQKMSVINDKEVESRVRELLPQLASPEQAKLLSKVIDQVKQNPSITDNEIKEIYKATLNSYIDKLEAGDVSLEALQESAKEIANREGFDVSIFKEIIQKRITERDAKARAADAQAAAEEAKVAAARAADPEAAAAADAVERAASTARAIVKAQAKEAEQALETARKYEELLIDQNTAAKIRFDEALRAFNEIGTIKLAQGVAGERTQRLNEARAAAKEAKQKLDVFQTELKKQKEEAAKLKEAEQAKSGGTDVKEGANSGGNGNGADGDAAGLEDALFRITNNGIASNAIVPKTSPTQPQSVVTEQKGLQDVEVANFVEDEINDDALYSVLDYLTTNKEDVKISKEFREAVKKAIDVRIKTIEDSGEVVSRDSESPVPIDELITAARNYQIIETASGKRKPGETLSDAVTRLIDEAEKAKKDGVKEGAATDYQHVSTQQPLTKAEKAARADAIKQGEIAIEQAAARKRGATVTASEQAAAREAVNVAKAAQAKRVAAKNAAKLIE